MPRLEIRIDLNNAALQTGCGQQIKDILGCITGKLEHIDCPDDMQDYYQLLRDVNGNIVGDAIVAVHTPVVVRQAIATTNQEETR